MLYMLGRAVIGIDIEAVQASVKEAVQEFFRQRIAIGIDGNPALGTMRTDIRNELGQTFVEERFVHQIRRHTPGIADGLQLIDHPMIYFHRHENFVNWELAGRAESTAAIAPGDSLDLNAREERDRYQSISLV
jgi:hypothetical protein